MSRRLGIRRPRLAGGMRTPAGLVKASGYTTSPTALPGGATIPAGSQVTDATSMLGALQARTTSSVNGATPLPRDEQFWALMGPGAPLYPAPLNTPNPATGQADPRRWQYPVSWNITQDAGRLVDWSTLRNAAREVDLIAQCIRVRRTEQSSLDWDITLSRRTIETNGITSRQDKNALLKQYSAEISRLIEFWSEPDTTNGYTWPEWVEMLIQEAMVTDATSIFPRFTYGGQLASLELIDGSTVKVLLDERGNRPHPPAAAYQQWLYGFPRGEYTDAGAGQADWEGTAGSLIYKPRYTRVNSPYGYSPVEQALVSAELWLRRQQWMVAEYTSGTAPRTFLKSNITALTPEQIRDWEDSLNDFYGGSTGNRHRMRLLPDGFDPTLVDDAAERYKPDYDEFLVRLICAHMDVQPQEVGFTPRNGLGGAGHGESQEAITYRKALRPTAQWLAAIMNQISYAYLDMPRDLTFQFLGLDDEDQDLADQTTDRQFRAGRITLNETRDKGGLPRYDFPEADMPMVVGQRGVVFLEGASALVEPGEEITPVQAPPLTAPPEGDSAYPPGEEPPVVRARQAKQQPAKQGPTDAAKAELAAYRNWARKNRSRPFEFTAVTKADAEAAGVDLGRVVFKAGDATGKGDAPSDDGGSAAPKNDIPNRRIVDSEPTSQGSQADVSGIVKSSNGSDLIVRKENSPASVSTLGDHVGGVLGVAADEEVVGSDARRVVTGVTDDLTGGNRAIGHLEGDAMGANGTSSRDVENPVSTPVGISGTGPNPAGGGTINLRPETVGKNDGHDPILSKESGSNSGPKLPSGRTWPGWTKDLAVAKHWAPEISRALTGAVNAREIAERWLAVRKALDPGALDALTWLLSLGLPIAAALTGVLRGIYTDGYVVGQQSADALRLDVDPAWGSWTPGDTAAARAMVGNEMNLRRLLDQQDITIKSIADHRLDELAKALSDALARGDSVDTLAKALTAVLDDPDWAHMVAVTETTRAVSYATLQGYLDNGIEAVYWMTAEDERVCQECADNEDAGANPINQPFPTGVFQPPQHPLCRCALSAAL